MLQRRSEQHAQTTTGFFAEGLNVGQLENVLVPYDQNPHWTLAGPDYYSSSNMNQISGPYPQGGTGGSFSCSSSIVSAGSEHATAVAGVIGSESEEGNPGNAAYATLKYGNGEWLYYNVSGQLECHGDLSRLVSLFDWFVDQNVHVLNESFACSPNLGFFWAQERVHSFYARYYDMVIIRAAGNMEDGNGHESEAAHPEQHQVSCRLRNGVCVGSKGLRSTNISLFSRYKNTSSTDRDEPDVVAPGDPLELIHGSGAGCGTGCVHEFNGIGGTSMAAPAVAGMAAMVLEQLPDWQGCRQSEWMRAILKASAIDHNEFFVPYWDTAFNNWGSEQGPRFARHDLAFGGDFENEDDAFGAGMPRFQRMLGWCCGAEDNWVESGDLELLPYDNLPPLNRIHPVLGMDHPNTGGESQLEQGFVYISSETEQPGRSGDSCSNDSLSFCDVPRGESDVQLRRVVVEWSECPDEMPSDPNQTPDSRIPLATDFNVSLTTPSGDTYWMSTSFDDTTEIFEFCAEEPGDYTIQVIPTQLGFGCARTPGDPNQTGEWLYVIESRTRDIDPELACPPLQHYGVGLN